MRQKTAIIIGAGPGGLTAAYELLQRTDIRPVVYEMTDAVGGISKTVNYKGNRIDIGGHRFFSKSRRVVDWWLRILPVQGHSSRNGTVPDAALSSLTDPDGPDPERTDRVMLVRERRSRILFAGRLFNYPLSASPETVLKLGCRRTIRILTSYFWARTFPIQSERSLEDFFVNRFGRALYGTFFKEYTEKLWGVSCDQISPEWGVQRVKGLSISKALLDAWRPVFLKDTPDAATETSLIKHFLYPKLGPGQLWSEVARTVQEGGGDVRLGQKIVGLRHDGFRITGVTARDETNGRVTDLEGDYFFSTMPVRELIAGLGPSAPGEIREIAQGLAYRDFITVGLLLKKWGAGVSPNGKGALGLIPDCWLYIHEPSVRMGRIQVFNNWSPYLLKDEATVWVGVEYFCNEGDELWSMRDPDLVDRVVEEMARIHFVSRADVLDSTVIRMPKAYPAYTGTYGGFDQIRKYTNRFENLFLIGRNGMHKYNNMDHSMLSAMVAVDNILHGVKSKDTIWQVNTEQGYQESACQKPC
jgi:protoporphyrinogen oxidase